jgi:hypothetical protein
MARKIPKDAVPAVRHIFCFLIDFSGILAHTLCRYSTIIFESFELSKALLRLSKDCAWKGNFPALYMYLRKYHQVCCHIQGFSLTTITNIYVQPSCQHMRDAARSQTRPHTAHTRPGCVSIILESSACKSGSSGRKNHR